jgi:hypothetical protein
MAYLREHEIRVGNYVGPGRDLKCPMSNNAMVDLAAQLIQTNFAQVEFHPAEPSGQKKHLSGTQLILTITIGMQEEFLHFSYHFFGCKLCVSLGREIIRCYDASCCLALNDGA